jgi:hypothetical protein
LASDVSGAVVQTGTGTPEPTWGLAQCQGELPKEYAPILKTFPDENIALVIAVSD